jgi:hypothetical protein
MGVADEKMLIVSHGFSLLNVRLGSGEDLPQRIVMEQIKRFTPHFAIASAVLNTA